MHPVPVLHRLPGRFASAAPPGAAAAFEGTLWARRPPYADTNWLLIQPDVFLLPRPLSCDVQVALDGSLVPLPQEQVQLLKARCGHGGLRVLALAYKDLLLQPTSSSGLTAAAVAGSGPQQQQQQRGADWQLLDDDDEQQDLVLIGLLALEDPGKSDMECMLTIFRF